MTSDRDGKDQSARAAARLLLLEDEAGVARVTELVLRADGYDVDVGSDLTSGAHLLAGNRYDLVLADTEQGSTGRALNGLAAFAKLAAPTPVVLFSAHRFSPQEISAAGLAGAIPKPFDVDELSRDITALLVRATTADQTLPAEG